MYCPPPPFPPPCTTDLGFLEPDLLPAVPSGRRRQYEQVLTVDLVPLLFTVPLDPPQ